MTREEAIEIINYSMEISKFPNQRILTATEIDEAKAMAIQALSQEPCDDTVSIRKDVLKCRVGKLVVYNVEWLKKHWQMEMDIVCGVKPCEDVVSRDMALEKMADYVASGYADSAEDFEEYSRIICQLPSVTQKSGKWVKDECGNVICSECKRFRRDCRYGHTNYCNHCGARMVEPQESEDKE